MQSSDGCCVNVLNDPEMLKQYQRCPEPFFMHNLSSAVASSHLKEGLRISYFCVSAFRVHVFHGLGAI